jgi:HEAT repeat protein
MSHSETIVNALIAATNDPDEGVAQAALKSLCNYQSSVATDCLVTALRSKSLKMREIVKSFLIEKQHPAVIPSLIEDLKSPRGYIRLKAAELMADFGDQSCVPELLKCLKDEHTDVRRLAATALGNIADPSTFAKLFSALIAEEDQPVSDALSLAIGKVGQLTHVQIILEAIVAKQPADQYSGTLKMNLENAATELLAKLGDVDGLLAALQHENTAIRVIAARVLGQLQLSQ